VTSGYDWWCSGPVGQRTIILERDVTVWQVKHEGWVVTVSLVCPSVTVTGASVSNVYPPVKLMIVPMSSLTSHSSTIDQYINSYFFLPSCKWLHLSQFSLGFVHEGFCSEGLFTSSGGRHKVTRHIDWNKVTILVKKTVMIINMIWIFFFFWTHFASLKAIITIIIT